METPEFKEHNHETEYLRETNLLQFDLAKRKFPEQGERSKIMMRWTTEGDRKYSKRFREFLDRELDADVDFWEKFKDPAFYEDFLKRTEEFLYADEKN